ncbi:MAG: hypothetical protein J0M03_10175 [Acidobacteria bacterium]|nr:hypothetical protein [Acidobacteriota bacterium]
MQNKNSDDLDFNIEEVEQVIAPQIDTGDPSFEDPADGGDVKNDDSDKVDDGDGPFSNGGGGRVTRSTRIYCC